MNEHTEQNINEAIDWLQQTGGQIQDFATTQAPLYCQEVVAWTFWMGFICSLIGAIFTLIGVYWVFKFIGTLDKNKDDLTASGAVYLFGSLIALMVGGFTFAQNIEDTIKAKVAPRLVIVEHLRGLNK